MKEFLKQHLKTNNRAESFLASGYECLSALAASSLAISLTLGDNQATRYIASKAGRATIRPFVKRPSPILLGNKKKSLNETPRGRTQPEAESSSPPSRPHLRSLTYCTFCLLRSPRFHPRAFSSFTPSPSDASLLPTFLCLLRSVTDSLPFHLCVCLSILFLCGWFSPVMGLGRLCSSHCCNVHVLQISPLSGERKKKKKLCCLTEDTGRCSPRTELSVSPPPSAALLFLVSFKV